MRRFPSRFATLAMFAVLAAPLSAQHPAPALRVPGAADRPIETASILGRSQRDVRLENAHGDVAVYHGVPLLEFLEKNGLDGKTMAGERKSVGQVVLATGREGYTVVFSVGELRANRSNPKVFLVGESSEGPLPENEGPIRLIVYGDALRSAYGLATIELKTLAENAKTGRP